MLLIWTLLAVEDREAIFDYISADSLRAAIRIDDQIEAQLESLIGFPELGRPGRIAGTRELVIKKTPFIAAYVVGHEFIRKDQTQ